MRGLAGAFLFALALGSGGGAFPADLRLGATHTLDDSGILSALMQGFESARGIRVRPLVAGTGQVLTYARNGDVDLVFTHSRTDEEALVASGVGKARVDVMWNEFVIAGPASDPARIRGMRDAAEALARIRAAGARFVSRGDDSGTHKKELQLWKDAGGLSRWPGYLSAGQGAGRSLMIAFELDAYCLVDRATHRQLSRNHPLAILVAGDTRLLNEYGVTTLRPAAGRLLHEAEAEAFAAWIVSDEARRIIAGFRIDGERAFRLPRERG